MIEMRRTGLESVGGEVRWGLQLVSIESQGRAFDHGTMHLESPEAVEAMVVLLAREAGYRDGGWQRNAIRPRAA